MAKIKRLLKKMVRVKKEKILIPTLEGNYLTGRCAFITGGSSGIGYSIAESFVKNGATVIITGRNNEKLEQAKKKLIATCRCEDSKVIIAKLDIFKVSSLEKDFLSISESIDKKIDIFVNNAGVNGGTSFPNTTEEEYDKILDTNLKGMYFMSQVITKYMLENKIEGNILNITSSSALRPAISPYIISKWGERALTLGMAKKLLPYGIIVNGLAPGSTSTPMLKQDDFNDLHNENTITKRFVAPEEVANVAVMLVSNMGKMIVGDTVYITGGAGIITYDDMKY